MYLSEELSRKGSLKQGDKSGIDGTEHTKIYEREKLRKKVVEKKMGIDSDLVN